MAGILSRYRSAGVGAEEGASLAFEDVYDATFDSVYRIAYAALRNQPDAEDAAAETYERAIRGISRFRGDSDQLNSWIFGIARNVTREYLRDRSRMTVGIFADSEVADPGQATSEVDPFDAQALQQAVGKLTPAQREVITMRLAGMKVREIAEALGKAEGTVKALQHTALCKLRKAMLP